MKLGSEEQKRKMERKKVLKEKKTWIKNDLTERKKRVQRSMSEQ